MKLLNTLRCGCLLFLLNCFLVGSMGCSKSAGKNENIGSNGSGKVNQQEKEDKKASQEIENKRKLAR